MWYRCRALGLSVLVLLALVACDPEVRALKPEETDRVAEVLNPLRRAAFGEDLTNCRVAARVLEVPYYEVWMRAAPDQSSCSLYVLLTAGVIDFTPRALQTLLAHELAHVQSKHQLGTARQREILSGPGATGQIQVLATSNAQFTPDEEAQADAVAARVLTDVWRGTNVGCLATADLYEDIRKDRSRWGHWLSRHPHPEQRVDNVVKLCEGELNRMSR